MSITSTATNQHLARILADQKLLPLEMIDRLVTRARSAQLWLGHILVEEHLLSYLEVANAYAKELGLKFVDLPTVMPETRALKRVPVEMCHELYVVPIELRNGKLMVAMANPLDETTKHQLTAQAHMPVGVVVAPLDEIEATIDAWYTLAQFDAEEEAPGVIRTGMNYANIQLDDLPTPIKASKNFDDEDDTLILDDLLLKMMEEHASDLHLAVGSPPIIRVDGDLQPMKYPVLTPTAIQRMVYAILTDVQITEFERSWELDMAYSVARVSRFRVNVHKQRGSIGAVLRTISLEMPTLTALNMPNVVRELTNRPRGLVLVTGPTGSGKSTTLAAMVDEINTTRRTHIVTVEDPIEFLHNNKMSVITQREVGMDTQDFTVALRHVLRQDPDVILIGEMRDLETISAALTAAETGHLVFATLHTTSASQTIDRIIDVFPPPQQEQVRNQLSNVIEGIITQALLPRADGKGRVAAQEIMLGISAIRNLIRENKVHQMTSVLQSNAKYGMQTLDSALRDLLKRRTITLEEAIMKASNPEDFKALVAM
ncbi:MAG: PilT/PilU family type 4a pilus ATPase [bacterium]